MTGLLGWQWWTDPVLLLINALAAFRLARLVVADDVPPMPRVRDVILRRAMARWRKRHLPHGADRTRDLYGDEPPVATLISCMWCSGWWVALAVSVLALVAGPWWYLLGAPLAVSAVVGIAAAYVDRGE